ncbi:hypothetical protein Tco_0304499 [Tanacetum coccineum]
MMTDTYCPRSKIKKLETKMWNLKVKGTDVLSYNQRFQELALMCDRMFLEESNVVEKYVGGLPDMIHESVKASKPKMMQEAIEFATKLMDKKILTLAERQAENKRKFEDTLRNNQTNNIHSKGTMWHGLTLLGLVRRNLTDDLNLCVPNATITMMGSVLPSALTEAIEFATKLMDKKILIIAERKAKNKRKFEDTSRNNQTNNIHSKGIMWNGLTLLGLVRRNLTEDLNLCAPNATINMMRSVLPSALTARGLAIRSVTVKADLLLPTITREPKRQIKEFSLALNVELRVISGAIT